MIKVLRLSDVLEMGAFVGIDPESDGLKRAARMGVPTTAEGIDGLTRMPSFDDIKIGRDFGWHPQEARCRPAVSSTLRRRQSDPTPSRV
jgi:acetaldehyde dehydrogenase